jgi:transcription-repair coupling factor (superfamily II helicase)
MSGPGSIVRSLPIAGARFACARPPGSADALVLSQLAAEARRERRLLAVIAADALDAQRLVDEIPYFDPSLAVRPLPDWETLPYDNLSPHQDLVSERLETLYRLSQPPMQGAIDVLVAPATAALYRLAPREYVAGQPTVDV